MKLELYFQGLRKSCESDGYPLNQLPRQFMKHLGPNKVRFGHESEEAAS